MDKLVLKHDNIHKYTLSLPSDNPRLLPLVKSPLTVTPNVLSNLEKKMLSILFS